MASFTDISLNNGKKITVSIARISTIGVYILADADTKVSVLALRSVASSIKDNILETVLVANVLVIFTVKKPLVLMVPERIVSPGETLSNLLSPVIL